jgi:hypothetical protein
MKRNKEVTRFIFSAVMMIGLSPLAMSCEDSFGVASGEAAQEYTKSSTSTAHEIMLLTQEVLDLTSDVLSAEGISIEVDHASPENCLPDLYNQYIRDDSHYDTVIYAGTIAMNFGAGTNCSLEGTPREGKIINFFVYIINMINPEFTGNISSSVKQTITFENFKRNDIGISGRISTSSSTGGPSTFETNSSTITFADGSKVVWGGLLTSARGTNEASGEQTRSITGNLHGSTVDGKFFSAEVLEAVGYSYECASGNSLVPVSGRIKFTVNQVEAILNYGNGNCDRTYTVTAGDDTKEYSFGN